MSHDEGVHEAFHAELAIVRSDVRDHCLRAALEAWEKALAEHQVMLDFPARMALLQEAIDDLCSRLTIRPN